MAWEPCTEGHAWEPIPGWYGRYKCTDCWVLGYRGTVLIDESGSDRQLGFRRTDRQGSGNIIAYRCPKCKGHTTAHKKGKAGACPKCRR